MNDSEIVKAMRKEYRAWLKAGEEGKAHSGNTFNWFAERMAPLLYGEATPKELGSVKRWLES